MRQQAQNNFNNPSNGGNFTAQDNVAKHYSNDWQALRANLVNLLGQVESQVALSNQAPMQNSGANYQNMPHHNQYTAPQYAPAQEQAPNSAQQASQFAQAAMQTPLNVAPPLMPQQASTQQEARFSDFSQALDKISSRLERFENQLSNNPQSSAEYQQISTQVEQLTKIVEQLSNNINDSSNFKNFEEKIEHIAKLLSEAPEVNYTNLNKRLDSLAQNVEQLSQLQSEAVEQMINLQSENVKHLTKLQTQNVEYLSQLQSEAIEQLSNLQFDNNKNGASDSGNIPLEEAMEAIKEAVTKIYERIDSLEQNFVLDPQDIERLFQEMGAISAETAVISQQLENGEANKDISHILSRINTLNEAIGKIKQNDDSNIKELQTELNNLQDSLRQALDPNFSLLKEQIKELISQGRQNSEQIGSLAKLLQENNGYINNSDNNELADLVASKILNASSFEQDNSSNNIANPDLLKEIGSRLSKLSNIIDEQLSEDNLKNIQKTIEQVDKRLEKLEKNIKLDNIKNSQPDANFAQKHGQIKSVDESLFNSSLVNAQAQSVEEALESIRKRFLEDEEANNQNEQEQDFDFSQSPEKEQNFEDDKNNEKEIIASEIAAEEKEEITPSEQHSQYINLLDNDDDFDDEIVEEEEYGHRLEEEFERIINDDANGIVYQKEEQEEQGKQEERVVAEPSEKNLEQLQDTPKEKIFTNEQISQKELAEQNLSSEQLSTPITPPKPTSELLNEKPAKPKSAFETANELGNISGDNKEYANKTPEGVENNEDVKKSQAAINITSHAAPPINNNSRNTFIEAARRASMRQNISLQNEEEAQSLLARGLSRIKNANFSGALNRAKKKNDNQQNNNEQKDEQISDKKESPLTKLASLFKKTNGKKETPEEAKQASPFARYYRPAILSIALIGAIVLMLNLFVGRTHTEDSSLSAQSEKTPLENFEIPENEQQSFEITQENEVAPNEEQTHPLIDETSTGSISKQVENQGASVRIIDQAMPVSLDEKPKEIIVNQNSEEKLVEIDSLTTNSIGQDQDIVKIDMLNLEQKTDSQQKANPLKKGNIGENTAPSPIKLELPDEKIGPIELREAAAKGDVRAQFEVGAIYGEGKLLEQDFEKAAIWFERAAANGFAPAALRLGGLYESGKGVEQNFEQAKLWYQRAAEAGNRMAMHNLASLYAGGELGEQRFLEAIEWFERAARLGLTDSQFNLGMLHARGLGVKQDLQKAYFWFAIAAKSGDKDAIKARDDVARSLNSDIIMEQKQRVANWQMDKVDIVANFAPIGTWAKDFNPGPKIENSDIIEKVQIALKKLGYDVGSPDGIMGPRTSEAIKEFESDTGMSPSGKINPRLLAVLGSQPV